MSTRRITPQSTGPLPYRATNWRWTIGVNLFLGLLAGLLIGVLWAWVIRPPAFTESSPSGLRAEYRDDYIILVAHTYVLEKDFSRADQRLEELGVRSPDAAVIDLTEALIERGGNEKDIFALIDLARAYGQLTPAMEPFLSGRP